MAEDADRDLNSPLPWHRDTGDRLWRARAAGRLPHALLLCGRAGLGKRRFAMRFAHALLCRTPDEAGAACGRCGACVLLAAGTHPDLRVCELEVNEKTQKERTGIVVDQVRELIDYLALKSHYDGARVVIIDPADRMNPNAANALLKILEEPPDGTLMILVSARPAALPATIRSRCQRLVFAPPLDGPERAAAIAWLAGRLGPGHDAGLLLNLAGGAPFAALALAAEGGLERRAAMLEDLRGLAGGDADPVRIAENWLKFGLEASLYWLYAWLADMVRLKADAEPPFMSNPDHRNPLAALAVNLEARSLIEQLERVSGALRDADGQVNPQLLMEDSLLGWVSINKSR